LPQQVPKDKVSKGGKVAATCLRVKHSTPKDSNPSKVWIIDSAATCHISFERSDFFDFEEVDEEIEWGTNTVCKVKGKGKIGIISNIGNQTEDFVMHSVLFVPEFRYKVFAIGAATRNRDWHFLTRNKTITAIRAGYLNFIATKNSENFYLTDFEIDKEQTSNNESTNCEEETIDISENSRKVKTSEESEKRESCAVSIKNNKEQIKNTTATILDKKESTKTPNKKESDTKSEFFQRNNRNNNDVTEVWHRRLGHACHRKIKEMKDKNIVRGMEDGKINITEDKCHCCMQMKATRIKFNKHERQRASGKLDVIHTDICGPMRIMSAGGAYYVLTFLDDFSRKSDVYLLKNKSEVFEKFRMYKSRVERETGRQIKVLRSDNGSEYINNKMDSYLLETGIKREMTTIYTPQQNGASERLNRTLVEKARCLLKDSGMPERFWGEAILTANYIRNHTKTSICNDEVPMELWTGRKPSVKFFRIFGCCAYARLPRTSWKGKFGERAIKGIFVGYDLNRKAYRVWSEEEQTIIHSRDVRFIENEKGWVPSKDEKEINEENQDYVLIDLNINMTTPELPMGVTTEENQEEELVEMQHGGQESQDQEENVSTDGEDTSMSEDEVTEDEGGEEEEEEEEGIDETASHWKNGRNLRERTPNVRPAKYSMIAGVPKRREPTVEELTRIYGWNKDYW
jgi:transposase InsO family protein